MAETTPDVWRTIRRDFYPWSLIVVFVALSAYANSLHVPDHIAQGMDRGSLRFLAALPPIASALAWHILVLPSFGGTDKAAVLRRVLARLVAAGVFAVAMFASWESLTDLGTQAGITHPTALPVCVDGLVLVAALAVWSHRKDAPAAGLAPVAPPGGDGPPPELSESVATVPRETDPTETVHSPRADRRDADRQAAETPAAEMPRRGGRQVPLAPRVKAHAEHLEKTGVCARATAYRRAKEADARGLLAEDGTLRAVPLHAVKG
jgi:hypothetical protein